MQVTRRCIPSAKPLFAGYLGQDAEGVGLGVVGVGVGDGDGLFGVGDGVGDEVVGVGVGDGLLVVGDAVGELVREGAGVVVCAGATRLGVCTG